MWRHRPGLTCRGVARRPCSTSTRRTAQVGMRSQRASWAQPEFARNRQAQPEVEMMMEMVVVMMMMMMMMMMIMMMMEMGGKGQQVPC